MAKAEKPKRKQQAPNKPRGQAKEEKRALKAERRQHRRKAQAVLTRADMAEQLRALATQVEAGTVVLGDKELELSATAEFEISYKPKRKGGHEIEVEIEWGSPGDVPLLPT
ncbi:amphi-Trp domain-containing protein [Chloroflexota bacterium]